MSCMSLLVLYATPHTTAAAGTRCHLLIMRAKSSNEAQRKRNEWRNKANGAERENAARREACMQREARKDSTHR